MRNVFLVTVAFHFLVNQPVFAKELAGEIVSVSGIVFIRPEKQEGRAPASPPKAQPGANVFSGDVINTSSDGSVKILMRDKTIVDIGASTLFKMDEYLHKNGGDRKAKLDMMFGKMRVSVSRKIEKGGAFQVKTNGATMGVRGTEFIVKEDIPDTLNKKSNSATNDVPKTQKTEITVVQGKVEVSAVVAPAPEKKSGETTKTPEVKTVNLTAGTQLTTGAGVAPAEVAPVKVTETQMQALKVETKIEDNTFAKAVTIDPSGMDQGGPSRSPSSEGKSNSGGEPSSFSNIVAAINVGLPPVISGPPPVIDVPGVPVNPFQNIGFRNNMRRISVTIVTAAPEGP